MKRPLLVLLLLVGLSFSAFADVGERWEIPFFLHSGLPYDPGQVSIRYTAYHQSLNNASSDGSGGHIEVGILDRVGLHLRNDALQNGITEAMAQFALLRSDDFREGIALTVENDTSTLKGRAQSTFITGFTAVKMIWDDPLHLSMMFDSQDSGLEIGASYIKSLAAHLFFIFEFATSSYYSPSFSNTSYVLEALRYRMGSLGISLGIQSPVSSDRDFDTRTLLQIEVKV